MLPITFFCSGIPSQIANLKLWLSAPDIPGLSDGNAISTWNDLSGNEYDLTQATESLQPLYKTNIKNGLPIVRFDGTDDYIRAPTISITAPYTFFIVSTCRSSWTAQRRIADGSMTFFNPNNNDRMSILAGGTQLNNDNVINAASNWHYYSCFFNSSGSTTSIYIDEGNVASSTIPSSGNISLFQLGGQLSPLQEFANVDIGEVLIYQGILSTSDQQIIENYLQTRWGF